MKIINPNAPGRFQGAVEWFRINTPEDRYNLIGEPGEMLVCESNSQQWKWDEASASWIPATGSVEADGTIAMSGPVQAPGLQTPGASIGIIKTRTALLRPGNISFNVYDLLHSRLRGYFGGDNSAELQYIKDAGGLYGRVMYPVYADTQWTADVFAAGIPQRDFADADFRPTFLQYSDELFADFTEYGLLMNPCLFWSAENTTAANGETIAAGFAPGSATRAFMARFVRWFADRYAKHPGLGFISFGNEWFPTELYSGGPISLANLSSCYAELSAALDTVAPEVMRTADTIYPLADSVATRKTMDEVIDIYATMFESLDAWNVHVYHNGSYVGRAVTYDAAVTIAAANNWGYEFTELSLAAFAAAAHGRGKLFIVGEIGVDTDREAVGDRKKQERFYQAAARHADLTMVWNVQPEDRALLPGSSQPKIFIAPGSTRGNVVGGLVADLNRAQEATNLRSIANPATRAMRTPKNFASVTTANSSKIYAPVKVALGASPFSIMGWFRPNSILPDFKQIARIRTANDGVVLLASSTDNAVYVTLTDATGAQAVSTSGLHKLTTPGVWQHFGLSYLPGTPNLVDIFIDGVFWTTRALSAAMGAVPLDNPMILGAASTGDATAGTDVSYQDWAVLPGRLTAERIMRHAAGEIAPESILHLRAVPGGPMFDMSKNSVAVTVAGTVNYA